MSSSFKSFVFLDLESTGLPYRESDGKRTRVTEICMICVTKEHLLKCAETSNFCPRVLRKVTLPINPRKVISVEASSLSGLDNFLLEHEEPFNEKVTAVITSFLNTCSAPFCLIAHNGYSFDFPLLREEFKKFEDIIIPLNVCCSDSKIAFRELSKIKELERVEFNFSRISPSDVNSDRTEPLLGTVNERDRSPIRLNSEITDTDLVFSEVADEIERLYSPRKENGDRKAMDVIRRINETTPKSAPVSEFSSSSSFNKPTSSVERRRLFTDQSPVRPSPNDRKTFSLKNVYVRLFGQEIENQHEAESDVIAMIKCCAKYGQPIIDWFENNNKRFGDIRSMFK